MTEDEVNFQEHIVTYNSIRLKELLETVRCVIRGGVFIACIWIIMNGLIQIATNSPDQLSALAKVIEVLKVNDIFSWIVTGITGTAWYIERNGKKRAIVKIGKLTKKIEENDSGGRTSSGLSETGDTPED